VTIRIHEPKEDVLDRGTQDIISSDPEPFTFSFQQLEHLLHGSRIFGFEVVACLAVGCRSDRDVRHERLKTFKKLWGREDGVLLFCYDGIEGNLYAVAFTEGGFERDGRPLRHQLARGCQHGDMIR
jgi:hypothetical protein